MKLRELKIGSTYTAKLSSGSVVVILDAIEDNPYGTPNHKKAHTALYFTDLDTGRRLILRSPKTLQPA